MLRSSNITDEDTSNNNIIHILESDTKKDETTNSCNKCNKLYELLRHKDQKNKKRFSIGKRVRPLYICSAQIGVASLEMQQNDSLYCCHSFSCIVKLKIWFYLLI